MSCFTFQLLDAACVRYAVNKVVHYEAEAFLCEMFLINSFQLFVNSDSPRKVSRTIYVVT